MFRSPNTTVTGDKFEVETIRFAWLKAAPIIGQDPKIFRKDIFGNWIKKSDYGNLNSEFGWEIDHIKPVIKKGLDYLDNLQPLHWNNNRLKGDNFLNWNIPINSQEPNKSQYF